MSEVLSPPSSSSRAFAAALRLSLPFLLASPATSIGCAPHASGSGTRPPRSGTANDVVAAAAVAAPRAAVMLPIEAARASSRHDTVHVEGPSGALRPRTAHPTSLCDQVPDPKIDAAIARFVRHPPGEHAKRTWSLELAGPLLPPRPGPAAAPPSVHATKPMRLVLRPAAVPGQIEVAIESGGWLLCALPTVRLVADGKRISELDGDRARGRGSSSLDVGVEVDPRGARTSFELSTELVLGLLAATDLELSWDGGRVELHPQRHEAVRSLAAHLQQAHDAMAAPTTGPGRGDPAYGLVDSE